MFGFNIFTDIIMSFVLLHAEQLLNFSQNILEGEANVLHFFSVTEKGSFVREVFPASFSFVPAYETM